MLALSLRTCSRRVMVQSASRSLSTTTATSSSQQQHKPVLTLYGVPARYANATFVAASKAGKLAQVESELAALEKAATSSRKFAAILENPLISRARKMAYVASLDEKLSPITRNLLVTMAGNARLKELTKVTALFARLMKAQRGDVDCKIISASALSPQQLKEVQAVMQTQVKGGSKKVILSQVIDPSIVGGLQVQIGDQFLDLSVKSRVSEIASMSVD